MAQHLDPGKLPEENNVLRRGRLFWPIFTAAIVCPAAVFFALFAIVEGVVDGWKIFPVAAFAMLFVYIAFSQVVSTWWCSSNYLNFTAEGFRWERLPILTWEKLIGSDGSEVLKVFTTSFYQALEHFPGWTKLLSSFGLLRGLHSHR